jgi:hypothetical protein
VDVPLLEWLKLKLSVKVTQPLFNHRNRPLRWYGLGRVLRYEPGRDGSITLFCQRGQVEVLALGEGIWRVRAAADRGAGGRPAA